MHADLADFLAGSIAVSHLLRSCLYLSVCMDPSVLYIIQQNLLAFVRALTASELK